MFNLVERLHVILTGWSLWPLKLQEAWCSSCFFIFVPLPISFSHWLLIWADNHSCFSGRGLCVTLKGNVQRRRSQVRWPWRVHPRKRQSLSAADTPRGKRRPGVGATALSHFHTTSLTDVLVLKQVLVALSVPPLRLRMGTKPSVVTPCQASVQLEVMWRFSSPSC